MADKKDRSKKVQKFKESAKKQSAQQAIPKTHLTPTPTWLSTDNLDLKGNILEAMQHQLFEAMEKIQQIGQALAHVMQQNIATGKIKIDYYWNNGEKATEAEATTFKAEVEKRQEQARQFQEGLKEQINAGKTGLVGPSGEPVGTTQELGEQPILVGTDDLQEEDEDNDAEASEDDAAE